MPYLSNLDGIRAIAVLLVVVSHLLLLLDPGAGHANIGYRTLGHVGVAIFFVHTTLVLMASLERHGSAALPFFVRRFFRIYPLSVAIVLLITLLQLAANAPIDIGRVLSNLLLVQNITEQQPSIGPLWSLPYEVQMYLCLPILYAIVTRTQRPVLCSTFLCAATIAMAALDTANLTHFHVPGTSPSLLRFAPCFISGVLAFTLIGRIPQVLHPLKFAAILLCTVALAPWLVTLGVPETPIMWAVCLVLGCTIPASKEITYRPVARAAKTVATYSYGVYLTHVFAFGAIDGLLPGPAIVQWGAMLILLPGLAYICYHGIEKHGIALGSRLAARYAANSKRAAFGRAPGLD